jgi:hypothetical protein
MSLEFSYPGVYLYWQLLWVQILLLVVVQFPTAATLFNQDQRYAAFLTRPLRAISPAWGRDLVIWVHALSGLFVLFANLACSFIWFAAQSTPITELLFSSGPLAILGWTNLAFNVFFLVMAVTGMSLYTNIRPNTVVPFWKFEYALSKQLHRLSFVLLVAILGYHIFFTPRVSLMWMGWLSGPNLFGLVMLLTLALWAVLAGQAVLMVWEWLTGTMYSKSQRSPSANVSFIAILAVVALGLIASLTTVPATAGAALGTGVILVVAGSAVVLKYRYRQ